eukprot:NODE_2824_length_1112_cov_50.095955_g2588_i0.p1 GENE.NODE_2824_length_1112_cov_50.095955_g2588_i0~~NODE_2824_length_1112_cov_50.095955_g2588_i0.p1  ORF type:complete len:255 (-),score=72.87 NODE_2824_length_1112_cov_50.095955_g2588_i0:97-861(-)
MQDGEIDIGDIAAEQEAEPSSSEPVEMSRDKQRLNKLFELRMKLNNARSMNKSAVMEEFVQQKEGKATEWRKNKELWKERKEKDAQDLKDHTLNPDKDYLNVTAMIAERQEKKREKKSEKAAPFGWEVFNQDAIYSSHKKRVRTLHDQHGDELKGVYSARRNQEPAAEFYPDADSLVVSGVVAKEDANGHERLASEIEETMERRKKFSRRRQFWQEADVDYINERNRVYNKKLKRSFEAYTLEIKQNLERGTAL